MKVVIVSKDQIVYDGKIDFIPPISSRMYISGKKMLEVSEYTVIDVVYYLDTDSGNTLVKIYVA